MEGQSSIVERRVYRDEMSQRMGRSKEWIRELERRSKIPKARYDEGSRRGYWLESEVIKILAGKAPAAERVAA
jgi:hypothetical protein